MQIKLGKILILALSALTLCGCYSVQISGEKLEQLPSVVRTAAEAIYQNDYEALRPYLSDDLRRQLTAQKFAQLTGDLAQNGELVHLEYLGKLRSAVVFSELWKLELKRTAAGDQTPVFTDKLLRLILAKVDGQNRIMGLVIQ